LRVWSCKFWESRGSRKTSASARAHLINRPRVVPTSASLTSITAPSFLRPCDLLVLFAACQNCRPRRRTAGHIIISILDHRAFHHPTIALPPLSPRRRPLRRHRPLLRMRRLQQDVRSSRPTLCSHVANSRPDVVRYRIRGSFPAVALSARLYPPHGRSFTLKTSDVEYGPTTAHSSRTQEQGTIACCDFQSPYRRSLAPSIVPPTGMVHTQANTSHTKPKTSRINDIGRMFDNVLLLGGSRLEEHIHTAKPATARHPCLQPLNTDFH
jgi:hypothetical protein